MRCCRFVAASRSRSRAAAAGHSSAVIANITESRQLPSGRLRCLRITPSRLAPSRAIARCDRSLRMSVYQNTRSAPSTSKARSSSISLDSVLTPLRHHGLPRIVWPIASDRLASSTSW